MKSASSCGKRKHLSTETIKALSLPLLDHEGWLAVEVAAAESALAFGRMNEKFPAAEVFHVLDDEKSPSELSLQELDSFKIDIDPLTDEDLKALTVSVA
jgi:hypothetical protein